MNVYNFSYPDKIEKEENCSEGLCIEWQKKVRQYYLNKLKKLNMSNLNTPIGVVRHYLNQGDFYKKLDNIFQFNTRDKKFIDYKFKLYEKVIRDYYSNLLISPILDRYLGSCQYIYAPEFRIYIVNPAITQKIYSIKLISKNENEAIFQSIVRRDYSCTPIDFETNYCNFSSINEIFERTNIQNMKIENFLKLKKWRLFHLFTTERITFSLKKDKSKWFVSEAKYDFLKSRIKVKQ